MSTQYVLDGETMYEVREFLTTAVMLVSNPGGIMRIASMAEFNQMKYLGRDEVALDGAQVETK